MEMASDMVMAPRMRVKPLDYAPLVPEAKAALEVGCVSVWRACLGSALDRERAIVRLPRLRWPCATMEAARAGCCSFPWASAPLGTPYHRLTLVTGREPGPMPNSATMTVFPVPLSIRRDCDGDEAGPGNRPPPGPAPVPGQTGEDSAREALKENLDWTQPTSKAHAHLRSQATRKRSGAKERVKRKGVARMEPSFALRRYPSSTHPPSTPKPAAQIRRLQRWHTLAPGQTTACLRCASSWCGSPWRRGIATPPRSEPPVNMHG